MFQCILVGIKVKTVIVVELLAVNKVTDLETANKLTTFDWKIDFHNY